MESVSSAGADADVAGGVDVAGKLVTVELARNEVYFATTVSVVVC